MRKLNIGAHDFVKSKISVFNDSEFRNATAGTLQNVRRQDYPLLDDSTAVNQEITKFNEQLKISRESVRDIKDGIRKYKRINNSLFA